MNNTKDDGGAAFPSDNFGKPEQQGMSLRDYFAAAALTGLIAQYDGKAHGTHVSHGAKYAYEMADAMLQARKEGA